MQIDKTWYQRPPNCPHRTTAGGVVIRRDMEQVFVAFVREEPGQMFVLPKGHVEEGETLEEAARREILEEAGFTDLALKGFLGIRERLDFKKRSWKTTHYFLFMTSQIRGNPTDHTHAYEVQWYPLGVLPPMFWPEQRELILSSIEKIRELSGSSKPASEV